MTRPARFVAVGFPHHITQRGNQQQKTFKKEEDYLNYLKLTCVYTKKYALSVIAFCLMPNHVHFVAIPRRLESMSRTFQFSHMTYTQYFNESYDLKGHLWKNRFFSCALDERHLYEAVRYVENNPVKAGLVKYAENWKWSSASAHLHRNARFLDLDRVFDFVDVPDWKEYLRERMDETVIKNIRVNTMKGRPAGNRDFIQNLSKKFGISLEPKPMGRPNSRRANKK